MSDICYPLVQERTEIGFEIIAVMCSEGKKNISINLHYFIQQKKVNKVIQYWSENKQKRKLNVLLFGMDSLSRLNFHRFLPKTVKFLKDDLNALEFVGYNKVGDNTVDSREKNCIIIRVIQRITYSTIVL